MRTQALLDRLTELLSQNCGDLLAAARTCGVSMHFVAQWRKDDKVTDEVIREAERIGNYGLVSAAIQRAVHGVEEPVFYKGVKTGDTITKYSDGLLTTLLKGKVDDFKGDGAAAPQITVNVANLMPRANTYEEWLAMRDMTVAGGKQPALADASSFAKAVMAPPDGVLGISGEVIEGTFKAKQSAFAGIDL